MLFVSEQKTQPAYILAGDESGAAAVGDIVAVSHNLKIGMATWPSRPASGSAPKRMESRVLYVYVHRSTIHNS